MLNSRRHQRLLGCRSDQSGPEYERLGFDGVLVMPWHRFDVDHHHGPIDDRDPKPYGNGVLLRFGRGGLDSAVARAAGLKSEIVRPRHRNPPEGGGGPSRWAYWLRDSDDSAG